jgi:uncharacterized repeat protein (TIGR01451 family)
MDNLHSRLISNSKQSQALSDRRRSDFMSTNSVAILQFGGRAVSLASCFLLYLFIAVLIAPRTYANLTIDAPDTVTLAPCEQSYVNGTLTNQGTLKLPSCDKDNQTTTITVTGSFNNTGTVYLGDKAEIRYDPSAKLSKTVSISAPVTAAREGETANFTVKLQDNVRTIEALAVNYTVAGANGELDYTPASGTVNISENANTGTLSIYFRHDKVANENNESVTVTLSTPQYASLGDQTATMTIIDDDTTEISISPSILFVFENQTTTFTVALGSEPDHSLALKLDHDNNQVNIDKSSLNFTVGDWNQTQTVMVTGVNQSTSTITLAVDVAQSSQDLTFHDNNVSTKTITVYVEDQVLSGSSNQNGLLNSETQVDSNLSLTSEQKLLLANTTASVSGNVCTINMPQNNLNFSVYRGVSVDASSCNSFIENSSSSSISAGSSSSVSAGAGSSSSSFIWHHGSTNTMGSTSLNFTQVDGVSIDNTSKSAITILSCPSFVGETDNPSTEFYLYAGQEGQVQRLTGLIKSSSSPNANGKYPWSITCTDYIKTLSLGFNAIYLQGNSLPQGSMSLPLNANVSSSVQLNKVANRKQASAGDIITYTIELQNKLDVDQTNIAVLDDLPPGFEYVSGSARWDHDGDADKATTNATAMVAIEPINIDSGDKLQFYLGNILVSSNTVGNYKLRYQLRVTTGVNYGVYTNTAVAVSDRGTRTNRSDDMAISLSNSADVNIVPDALFELATLMGKVFNDLNGNGWQDPGDLPLPYAKLITSTGQQITTDSHGRYHLANLYPGRMLIRLDQRGLPSGSVVVGPSTSVVDIRPGLPAKANFAVQFPDFVQSRSAMKFNIEQLSDKLQPRLNLAAFGPALVDQVTGNLMQPLEIRLYSNYPTFIERWQVEVVAAVENQVVHTFMGDRSDLFKPIYWNGVMASGTVMDTATDYVIRLKVTSVSGRQDNTLAQELPVRLWSSDDPSLLSEPPLARYHKWLYQLAQQDRTAGRDIQLKGKTVRISGDVFSGVRISQADKVLVEVPYYRSLDRSAAALLEGSSFDDDSVPSIELILPRGKMKLEVLQNMPIDSGQANHTVIEREYSLVDRMIAFLIPKAYGADVVPSIQGLTRYNNTWLQQQPGSGYTIQLFSTFDYKDLANFIMQHQLDEADLALFSVPLNGKPHYALVKGIYPHYLAARQAMKQLPLALRVQEPQIRTLDDIHEALAQQIQVERPSRPVFEQQIDVGAMDTADSPNDHFLVGIIDAEVGYNTIHGNLQLANSGDKRYRERIWKDGKIQLYFKGTVEGQYLITANINTDRNSDNLFHNLDPNASYAVYGDDAKVTNLGEEAYGALYLLIEKDASWAKWGQVQAAFDKTELTRYQSNLQGAQVHYESSQSTSADKMVTKADVFIGKTQFKTAHNEFLVTGSSLYYLKHQQSLMDSLSLKLEQRNQSTGMVTSSQALKLNTDYEFNAAAGRITFWKPPQQPLTNTSTNIETFLVADYSYSVAGDWSKGTHGGRIQQQLNDRMVLGVTNVQADQQDSRYQLQGIDSDIQLTKNHHVYIEAARSQSRVNPHHVSTDGGLNWAIDEADITQNDQNETGAAISIRGEIHLPKQQTLLNYYGRQVSEHFSSNATAHQRGQKASGMSWHHQYDDDLSVRFSHDRQTQLAKNPQSRSTALNSSTQVLQANYQVDDRLNISGELTHQREDMAASVTVTDKLAVSGNLQINPNTSVVLSQQTAFNNSDNNLTQANIKHQLTPELLVGSQFSHDRQGNSYQVDGRYTVNEQLTVSAGMQQDMVGQQFASAGVGYRANRVSLEANLSQSNSGQTVSQVGAGYNSDDDTEYKLSWQQGTDSDAASQSVALGVSHHVDPATTVAAGASLSLGGADRRVGIDSKVSRNLGDGQSAYASVSRYASEASDNQSTGHEVGLGVDLNNHWAVFFNLGQGYVYRLDSSGTDRRNNLALGVSYSQRDMTQGIPLEGRLGYERQEDRGQSLRDQQRVQLELKSQSSRDTTWFTNLNWSEGINRATGLVDLRNNRFDLGFAYRPVLNDQLNTIVKYTWLDDQQPLNQSGITGLEQEKAQVVAVDFLYDLNPQFHLGNRLAWRWGKEKITDMPWANRHLWLVASRLGYRVRPSSLINLEYRLLNDIELQDNKAGTVLELVERFNDAVEAAIGLNWAGFDDDLGDLDYTNSGVYVRVSGILEN